MGATAGGGRSSLLSYRIEQVDIFERKEIKNTRIQLLEMMTDVEEIERGDEK